MTYRFRNIAGSLNALLVLETVVRQQSFTRAAAELSVSQPTISRHIATLEKRLNRSLFVRNGNQVLPTSPARRLAAAVALGFGHAESAWEELRYEALEDEVTLACSFGFAENWLMPRYAGLKRALDGTRLRVSTFDKPTVQQMERIDIAIVWDISLFPERPSFALFNEEAYPVCSPRYLQENPGIDSAADALARADLIQFDVGDSGFATWRLWFAMQGLDYRAPRNAHQYDALPFSMQAVLDGEGVGLGWRYLVDQMLDDGRLVRIGPAVTNREVAYYLQYRDGRPNGESIGKVVAWFKQAIASSPAMPVR